MTPERMAKLEAALLQRQFDLTVVLENVVDPHNISAVMRSCDAVGIQHLYVLNTESIRYKRWGFRSSGSAYKWLTVHQFENVEECIRQLRQEVENIYTTSLSGNAKSLYEIDFTHSTALVFGNEHSGCSVDIQALGDGNMLIPQVGMVASLNISVACAVSIFEAARQKRAAGHYQAGRSSSEKINALRHQWLDKTDDHT